MSCLSVFRFLFRSRGPWGSTELTLPEETTPSDIAVDDSKLQRTLDAFPQLFDCICDSLTAAEAIGMRAASRGLRAVFDAQPWNLDIKVSSKDPGMTSFTSFMAAAPLLRPRGVAISAALEPRTRDPDFIHLMARATRIVFRTISGEDSLEPPSTSASTTVRVSSPAAAPRGDQITKLSLPGYVVSEFSVIEVLARACPGVRELRITSTSHRDDLWPVLHHLSVTLERLTLCQPAPWSRQDGVLSRLLTVVIRSNFVNYGLELQLDMDLDPFVSPGPLEDVPRTDAVYTILACAARLCLAPSSSQPRKLVLTLSERVLEGYPDLKDLRTLQGDLVFAT